MITRLLVVCVLSAGTLVAQSQRSRLRGQAAPDTSKAASQAVVAGIAPSTSNGPAELPADTVVISIQGLCAGEVSKSAPEKCATNITKAEFERMVSAMSFNPQLLRNPVALRSFAESYAQALAMADAAEKAGVDKDPQFEELMKVVRVRTLADAYRRAQQADYSKVEPEAIEAYYKEHGAKFEQLELDRIFLPKSSGKATKQSGGDFESKTMSTATAVRERAAKGEDMGKLQVEAYKSLGLTPPLTSDMGSVRHGALPPAIEQEVFSLAAGDVTRVETDATGFTIYKVRSRASLPLERVRDEIAHAIAQSRMDAASQSLATRVHSDLNPQFFSPKGSGPAPMARSASVAGVAEHQ